MAIVSVDQAVTLLKSENVVTLPTETVYGLAGLITSTQALESIFSIKARPFFDPLIVHVQNPDQALTLAHFGKISERLAHKFWPGPLTLVLPKKKGLSDLITSGGPTVALRSPNHPLFQQVLKEINTPLAAPSANRFGHTSPTQASHVLEEFSSVAVLDGGPCKKGIESTIVEVNEKTNSLKVLRPGVVSSNLLKKFFQEQGQSIQVEYREQSNTPGYFKNHYQPTSPLVLIFDCETEKIPKELLAQLKQKIKIPLIQWTLPQKPQQAARNLYRDLRFFSKNSQACYLLLQKQWTENDEWKSLLDRLTKAAHFIVLKKNNQWSIEKKTPFTQ